MTDTLNARALPLWDLIEKLVAASCYRDVLHKEYMGREMPDSVAKTFFRLRDQRIPELQREVKAALAARSTTPSPAAPDGWRLVPIEPTSEMVDAAGRTPGMRAIDSASTTHQLRGYPLPIEAFADGSAMQQAYRAMLAAAPVSPNTASGV